MGLADLIPGISGGTVAFALGIYVDLMTNLKNVDLSLLKAIFRFDITYIKSKINIAFFLPLFLGIIFAIAFFSKIFVIVFKNDILKTMIFALFLGFFIHASSSLIKSIKKWSFTKIILVLIGFFLSFFLFKNTGQISNFYSSDIVYFDPFLIILGAAAISAMLLPGISGSLIFLLSGRYFQILSAISEFITKGDIKSFFVLLNLSVGIFLGFYFFIKVISFFIKRFYDYTFCFLIGLMFGSIKNIVFIKPLFFKNNIFMYYFLYLLFIFIGFILFYIIKKVGMTKKNKDISCI